MHALHDAFRKMRSFVFIERVSEVTEVFEKERDFSRGVARRSAATRASPTSPATPTTGACGRSSASSSRTTCTRARRSSCSATRARTAATRAPTSSPRSRRKAGRTFWLNPEPRLYWNYGDSVISAYEEYCEAFECWTTQQLEDFVKALTRPIRAA